MRIKVLQSERWMMNEKTLQECIQSSPAFYRPCIVTFGRPGIYLYGDHCWFEVNGSAWTFPKETFIYTLSTLNVQELSQRHITALESINEVGLASKEQRELLRLRNESKMTNEMLRKNRFIVRKAIKRLKMRNP